MATSSVHKTSIEARSKDGESLVRDRWLALVILGVIYGLSTADRFLMSIFMEPIKKEFSLSDSGVGFITGVVFAIFYVGASLPMGRIGDRTNRRKMLAICTGMFSLMTAFAGLAHIYLLLLFSRVGVAVAEAGFTPVATAFLSDKFTARWRYAVMSLFCLGIPVGAWAGVGVAGALEARAGWQGVMVIFGLAGIPLALLVLVLREPIRGFLDGVAGSHTQQQSTIGDVLRVCIARKSVRHAMLGGALLSFWSWGLIWWAPAFLGRSFGVSIADAGAKIGAIHGILGTGAVLAAAIALVPLARGDISRPLRWLSIWMALSTIPSILAVSMMTVNSTMLMFWLFLPVSYASSGVLFGTVSSGVPPHMRGQALGICIALGNLAGIALAPQLVGTLSDVIANYIAKPAESLRYALLPLAVTGFWAAWHFFMASRHIKADIERLRLEAASD